MQSQSVRSAIRLRACFGRGYVHVYNSAIQYSVEASRDTEVENRTTGKHINSCNGNICVARQRPVRRFAALAWRHSVMFASCLYKACGDLLFVVLLEKL